MNLTAEQFREALAETAGQVVAICRAETERLQKRVADLEAHRFKYCGVHAQGRAYRKGHAVTSAGSLWIAMRDYPDAPGAPDSGWTLAVKRGRDAR